MSNSTQQDQREQQLRDKRDRELTEQQRKNDEAMKRLEEKYQKGK